MIQFTEMWLNLRILWVFFKIYYIRHWTIHCWCFCFDFVAKNKRASLSALTLNTEACTIGVFVLTLKFEKYINKTWISGRDRDLLLAPLCITRVLSKFRYCIIPQPPCCMTECICPYTSYSCSKFALSLVSNVVHNHTFVW